MIILLSPSKTLDFSTPVKINKFSTPKLLDHSKTLIKEFKEYSSPDLQKLMKVSPKIAQLNYERFKNFTTPFTLENARQAIFAFSGDVYKNITPHEYNIKELMFMQEHLRTLSGLYGVLKPLDLMQPYRLEMHLKTDFWKKHVTEYLKADLKEQKAKTILNLASNEYFKSIDTSTLNIEIHTPIFKEKRNDTYKIIALYAKIARGTMTNYVIKNSITDPKELKNFKEDGYKFAPALSKGTQLVFTRG